MSKVWFLILMASLTTLLFVNPSAAINAMIKGSHDAVNLAMSLVALYAFWLGLFAIIERTGIANKLAKLLKPVVKFLFPGETNDCYKYITMNISANILGLGNASTPMAISAIGQMRPDSNGSASQNMIMMVVISATSLQLLPTTVIGMRATAGSVNPADFLIPTIIATVCSTVIGVTLVKFIGFVKTKIAAKKATKTANIPANISAPKTEKISKGFAAYFYKKAKAEKK